MKLWLMLVGAAFYTLGPNDGAVVRRNPSPSPKVMGRSFDYDDVIYFESTDDLVNREEVKVALESLGRTKGDVDDVIAEDEDSAERRDRGFVEALAVLYAGGYDVGSLFADSSYDEEDEGEY